MPLLCLCPWRYEQRQVNYRLFVRTTARLQAGLGLCGQKVHGNYFLRVSAGGRQILKSNGSVLSVFQRYLDRWNLIPDPVISGLCLCFFSPLPSLLTCRRCLCWQLDTCVFSKKGVRFTSPCLVLAFLQETLSVSLKHSLYLSNSFGCYYVFSCSVLLKW